MTDWVGDVPGYVYQEFVGETMGEAMRLMIQTLQKTPLAHIRREHVGPQQFKVTVYYRDWG